MLKVKKKSIHDLVDLITYDFISSNFTQIDDVLNSNFTWATCIYLGNCGLRFNAIIKRVDEKGWESWNQK